MRKLLVVLMVVIGFGIQVASYFFWSAPIGLPVSEVYSNPRIPYAPLLFIIGIVLVFLSAVVYELLPDKKQ